MRFLDDKKKKELSTYIIMLLGIVLRLIVVLLSDPRVSNHDVSKVGSYGHLDYAIYIFKNFKLAPYNTYEFAQPPLNAILQALVMKVVSLCGNFGTRYMKLFEYTKVLNFAYSVITLYFIYKILNELEFAKKIKNFVLLVFAIYPGYLAMATQFNNDGISNMFFFISLYLSIRWCKQKDLKTIILLALSIGFGMLSKISVGLIAFITGPMMIVIWLRSIIETSSRAKSVGISATSTDSVRASCASPSITVQLVIFALIVFPLGLSYAIRNYVLFNQKFVEIFEIAKNGPLDMRQYSFTIYDRFLSFPIERLFGDKNGFVDKSMDYYLSYMRYGANTRVYHQLLEYNIWIDLIKTATFDEYNFGYGSIYIACVTVYVLNIVFFFAGFISIIINIVKLIKNKAKSVYNNILNARIISIMLFVIAMLSYIGFNYNYPYSCNSNFRYIPYLLFSYAVSIPLSLVNDKS